MIFYGDDFSDYQTILSHCDGNPNLSLILTAINVELESTKNQDFIIFLEKFKDIIESDSLNDDKKKELIIEAANQRLSIIKNLQNAERETHFRIEISIVESEVKKQKIKNANASIACMKSKKSR